MVVGIPNETRQEVSQLALVQTHEVGAGDVLVDDPVQIRVEVDERGVGALVIGFESPPQRLAGRLSGQQQDELLPVRGIIAREE
jgi:hypothetical protein